MTNLVFNFRAMAATGAIPWLLTCLGGRCDMLGQVDRVPLGRFGYPSRGDLTAQDTSERPEDHPQETVLGVASFMPNGTYPRKTRMSSMRVTENGVAIQELIETVKQTIKTANLSNTDLDRDLRIGSVELILNAVATHSLGGGVDFRIPFIGMQVKAGCKLTRQDTHTIDISLVPPDLKDRPELRDSDLGSVFVDAINAIRMAVASAAAGDDPFTLTKSKVNISFAITAEGNISLGIDGGLASELTHTLTLSLVPA